MKIVFLNFLSKFGHRGSSRLNDLAMHGTLSVLFVSFLKDKICLYRQLGVSFAMMTLRYIYTWRMLDVSRG